MLLYFVNDVLNIDTDRANELGLGYAVRPGSGATRRAVNGGPGGMDGQVFAWQEGKLGYYPNEQEWVPLVDENSTVWVGVDTDKLPSPEELARPQSLPGFALTLGDGNRWTMPICKAWDELQESAYCTLPSKLTRNKQGKWEANGKPTAQYQHLFNVATRFFAEAVKQNETSEDEDLIIEYPEAEKECCKLLSANYYASEAEAELLGLFTTQLKGIEILALCTDLHTWHSWKKKQEPATSYVG